MSILNVIDGVQEAVDISSATEFPVLTAALITADGFAVGEKAIVWRLGPSGEYEAATNKKGAIVLSAVPNTAKVEGPGLFKITKDYTQGGPAYVGYEE